MDNWENKEGQQLTQEAANCQEATAAQAPAAEAAPAMEAPAQPAAPQQPASQQSYVQQPFTPGYSAPGGYYGQPYGATPYNYNYNSAPYTPGYYGYTPGYTPPAKAPAAPKAKAKKSNKFLRFLAAALAVVLVAALSGGITAACLEDSYTRDAQQMQSQLDKNARELEQLRRELSALNGQTPALVLPSQGELPEGTYTPAQVYSACVGSVVFISNQELSRLGGYATVGTGSGFILTSDGYIVSNHHVVDGAERLLVTLSDGRELEAELVGSDNINDVAVLKVESDEPLPAVNIGSSSALKIGDQVMAIGNPLGTLTVTATVGYVSGKDRPVNTDGIVIDMLQTDAAINSGNSGGPLFNMYGQVVGITTAKYSGTTNSGASIEGIGFAIPIDDVYGMIDDFMNHGFITGGYLGVMVSSIDPDAAQAYNLPVGAYVSQVTAGSCAEKAGIKVEDVITDLGGYPVENLADLTRALRNFQAGEAVSITVYRSGEYLELTAVLDAKPVS